MNHSWIIPMNYLWIFLPICTQRNAINCDTLLFIVKLKLTSLTLSFNFLYVLNWSRGERGSSSLLLTLLFPEIQFLISLLEKKCTKKHCNGRFRAFIARAGRFGHTNFHRYFKNFVIIGILWWIFHTGFFFFSRVRALFLSFFTSDFNS